MSIETSLRRLKRLFWEHWDSAVRTPVYERIVRNTTASEWQSIMEHLAEGACHQQDFLAFLIDRCEWLDAELTAAKVDASVERVNVEQWRKQYDAAARPYNTARTNLGRITDERDQAKRERINAVQELNEVRDRAAYLSETLNETEHERDDLLVQRDNAYMERDAALRKRDEDQRIADNYRTMFEAAINERDDLRVELKEVQLQLDSHKQQLAWFDDALSRARRERDEALATNRALREDAPAVRAENARLVAENTKLVRRLNLLECSDARLVAIFDRCDAAIETHKLADEFGMVAYEDMVPTLLDKLTASRHLSVTTERVRDGWRKGCLQVSRENARLEEAARSVLKQHMPCPDSSCDASSCTVLRNLNTVLENNDNGK